MRDVAFQKVFGYWRNSYLKDAPSIQQVEVPLKRESNMSDATLVEEIPESILASNGLPQMPYLSQITIIMQLFTIFLLCVVLIVFVFAVARVLGNLKDLMNRLEMLSVILEQTNLIMDK